MAKKKDDQPYMPFYIGDWKKAPEIRALPLDVKMVWIELLLLMWQSDEKGYLTIKGVPYVITDAVTGVITEGDFVLGCMIGVNTDLLQKAFRTLKKYNVFSVRDDGAVYSRFMVKLVENKRVRSEGGQKGMKNRYGKKPVITESLTVDITNADNETEYINNLEIESEISEEIKSGIMYIVAEMFKIWKKIHPDYPKDQERDYHALLQFAYKIAESKKWRKTEAITTKELGVLEIWSKIASYVVQDKWFKDKPLSTCFSQWQGIIMGMNAKKEEEPVERPRTEWMEID